MLRARSARAAAGRFTRSARASRKCLTLCRCNTGSSGWSVRAMVAAAVRVGSCRRRSPPQPIDGGVGAEAVLAHVATMKYGSQVPLYRQEQMLAGQGIDLDRATLALWMGRLAWWLKPLHEVLLDTILSYPKLFADETPLPVLDPGRGKTKTCRLWVAAMDDRPWGGPAPPAVVYVFAEDRKGERATEQFEGF